MIRLHGSFFFNGNILEIYGNLLKNSFSSGYKFVVIILKISQRKCFYFVPVFN